MSYNDWIEENLFCLSFKEFKKQKLFLAKLQKRQWKRIFKYINEMWNLFINESISNVILVEDNCLVNIFSQFDEIDSSII